MEYFGNKEILKLHKTAFFCSRKCPADIILKSLDWAKNMKDKGKCVISGSHSTIEKDVFEILLKGTQPMIMVLARGMKKQWSGDEKKAVEKGRLLVMSPFKKKIIYITQKTANKRNRIIADIADEIFLAYAMPDGNLDKFLQNRINRAMM